MKEIRQNSTESTAQLTAKKTEVILAFVRGATASDATRQADIDRRHVPYLWLRSDEAFLAELNRAKARATRCYASKNWRARRDRQ